MNISSVSSVTNSTISTTTTASTTAQLKRQIEALQAKIEAENSSDDDAKTKAQKVQLFQAQLTALQAQLQVLQTNTST